MLKNYLETRRSTPFPMMGDLAPTSEQLAWILQTAARVPDHGKLNPWRFIIVSREKGLSLGEKIAAMVDDQSEARQKQELARFTRAPLCIVLVSTAAPHAKIPEWEQVLSAGAVGMNLLNAAAALGFGGNWVTEWLAYDDRVKALFDLAPQEKIAGFIHIGEVTAKADDRIRPDMSQITKVY